jgi:hypothetical protein
MKKLLLLTFAILSLCTSVLAQVTPSANATTKVISGTRGVLNHYTWPSMIAAGYRDANTAIPTDEQLRTQNPGQYQARMGLKAELDQLVKEKKLVLRQASLPTAPQMGYWYRGGTHVSVYPDTDGVIRAFFSGNWLYTTTAAPAGYWYYCLPDLIWTECSEWEGQLPDGTPAHFEQTTEVSWGIAADGMDKDGCGNPTVVKVPHITLKVTPHKKTPLIKKDVDVFFYIEREAPTPITQVINDIQAGRHSVGGVETFTVKNTKEIRVLVEIQQVGGGISMACILPPGVCPGGPPIAPIPPLPPGMTTPPNDDENRPPRIGRMPDLSGGKLLAILYPPLQARAPAISAPYSIFDGCAANPLTTVLLAPASNTLFTLTEAPFQALPSHKDGLPRMGEVVFR